MRAVLVGIEKLASNISVFKFKPEQPLWFEPGQFVEIHIPHPDVDERGDSREFSITSTPDEPYIELTINFAANGSSFKRALRRLVIGDAVSFATPMGDFVLPKDMSIPLVFVAAGIGSTPYVSMIKWLTTRGEKRDITLIYSASTPDDFLFTEFFQDYPLAYFPILSRPNKNWHGETGRLDVNRLLAIIGPVENKLIYLAGPQSFIEPLYNDLLAAGIARRQLLLDYFPGY